MNALISPRHYRCTAASRIMTDRDELAAHLWDLRAQAEAKLRCLTRVQQLLAEHERSMNPKERAVKRAAIIEDIADIGAISNTLRSMSTAALRAAKRLS
jgi:DNA-binding transcriptional regulator PaaX